MHGHWLEERADYVDALKMTTVRGGRFVTDAAADRGRLRYSVTSMNTRFDADPRRRRYRAPRFSLQLWFRKIGWVGRTALLAVVAGLLGLAVWAAGEAQPLSSITQFRGGSSIVIAG